MEWIAFPDPSDSAIFFGMATDPLDGARPVGRPRLQTAEYRWSDGNPVYSNFPAAGVGHDTPVARKSCRGETTGRGLCPISVYPYIQRLGDTDVLLEAMRDGVSSVTWRAETFGFAEAFDEAGGRYLGLRGGQVLAFGPDAVGLLVRSSVADFQLEADRPKPQLQVPGSAKPLASTGGGKLSKSSSEGGQL